MSCFLASCVAPGKPVPTTTQSGSADDSELVVYSSRPRDSWHVTVADFESQQTLTGASAVVLKPANPRVPASKVSANLSAKNSANDALTLHMNDAWYANLRIEGGAPLDLRPYVAQGVLAFDLNVVDLAKGGLAFKLECGSNCGRKIPYLVPARAMAGKGWQHMVFSLRCFVRDGDDFSAVTVPFALDASGTGEVAVANVKFQKTGTPNAACPDYKTVSVTPDMLNESWSVDWWLPRHLEKLEEIKSLQAHHQDSELVFIGDSITHNWEKDGINVWNREYKKYHALDLGFGGDRTENILWRLQHGEVDGIHPKVAVLMFGTNNTGERGEDPRTTAAGIKRNIDELRRRLPETKILLLAIFPRDEKPDSQLRKLNEQINAIISGFSDNKKIFFLNINQAFLADDGTLSKDIMPDLLHPNEKGYEIWARAMEPELQRLMK
jgi:beta-glucosidase